MKLVLRRARRARGLLTAASTATLLAVVLLTGLSLYGGQVIDSGTRAAVSAAPAEERSILVTGSGSDFADADRLDDTVRRTVGDSLGGVPISVSRAGYAVGQQLPSQLGEAQPGDDGLLLASVVFLDDLAAHASLTSGAWPRPSGQTPGAQIETALAEPVAELFGVAVGDQIPLTDRRSGQRRTIRVTGVWQPDDSANPYWRLVPGLRTGGLPGTATYGPLVVDRADFARHFADLASLGWLLLPDLSRVTSGQLNTVEHAAGTVGTTLTRRTDDRLSVTTRLDELTERLARSAVVARSALLIPALLLVVIAGYALLLVAGLLADQRRGENALIRARGAGSRQIAGLAAAESGFVIGPALLLGAPLAVGLLSLVDRLPWVTRLGLRVDVALTPTAWLAAAVSAVGCGLALVLPALRRGDTYVAEQQSRSRVARRGLVQRAGLDLALGVLAVLAWLQLRQYKAPVLGLEIDPVLVVGPTIGLLAATVLALRLLPLITQAGQRIAERRHSFGTLLGAWQAGRRPHAGTVLLLSLAVGVATLAIYLEGTSQRSLVDQASHRAGADLRVVEVGSAPSERIDQLTATPGVTAVLPTVTTPVTIGAEGTSTVVMLDARRAADVVRPRDDLTDRPAGRLFDTLAGSRKGGLATPLPAVAGNHARLTGEIDLSVTRHAAKVGTVETKIDVRDRHGMIHTLPLADVPAADPATTFDVELPAGAVEVYGFRITTRVERRTDTKLTWTLQKLGVTAGGRSIPLDLGGQWRTDHDVADEQVSSSEPVIGAGSGRLSVTRRVTVDPDWTWSHYPPRLFGFVVLKPVAPAERISVLVTPRVLTDTGGSVGSEFALPVAGGELRATVVGVIDSIPGVPNDNAVLVDLETMNVQVYAEFGSTLRPTEWRLATRPDQHEAAARAVAALRNAEVTDRHAVAREPLGTGARLVLLPAALAAALLAALGIAVDARATARRRAGELAVLHTVGSGQRTLARALVTEQALLAGLGVLTGLGVGGLVAWAMAPLLVLTPGAARPVPTPVLVADPLLLAVPVAGLLLVAFGLATTVAAGVRRNLASLVVKDER